MENPTTTVSGKRSASSEDSSENETPTIAEVLVTLQEYCSGKPLGVQRALSVLHGDPRHTTKTQAEWAAAEQSMWERPSKH